MIALAQAKILEFSLVGPQRQLVPLKEVCSKMGIQDPLLASPIGQGEVDCMGKTIRITDFCLQEFGGRGNLLRGRIDSIDPKNATCEFATNATLKVLCDEKDRRYCESTKSACEKFQKTFAVQLELSHNSRLIEAGEQEILRCYYQSLN